MIIAVGSDHAGFELKQTLIKFLTESGYEVNDIGPHSNESVDYPDFASKTAIQVSEHNADTAIVICGSGIGVSIVANKIANIRCALCMNPEMASLARQHNDANMLALGARLISDAEAIAIVSKFLDTAFAGGRHQRRVGKIHQITNC